jgi:REP element-mobilizing transposase RayT
VDPARLLERFEPPLRLGSCWLGQPEIANLVQNAFLHFNKQRYELVAWCVMPNHVHVVFTPFAGYGPSTILNSWKGFTGKKANEILKRHGPFWERESFDHLIRTAEDVERFAKYVEDNPVEAGLCSSAEDWPYSSAGVRFQSPLGRR